MAQRVDAFSTSGIIDGPRYELDIDDARYPASLRTISRPPKRLYVLGDLESLEEGLAVVGARRATPYGIGCAKRFAGMAASRGITIVSGGARGCDAAAHEAALTCGGKTVAVLGGGIDKPYPAEHKDLFRRIVGGGGVLLSEHDWNVPPLPYAFRERNRIISGLSRATLIVEAGLPSGTFSTADAALSQGREVLVVPGAITSKNSRGANRLLYQGAHPVVDDESFEDALFGLFGRLKQEKVEGFCASGRDDLESLTSDAVNCDAARAAIGDGVHEVLSALLTSEQASMDRLYAVASGCPGSGVTPAVLMVWLAEMRKLKLIAQYPDGSYGPCVGEH
ncbi:MAG: DNA-processing protein DprA [Eggerthellaceae bacterium]|nr:DNA-processing protein DprA [Eggerthellaceae bacterium]